MTDSNRLAKLRERSIRTLPLAEGERVKKGCGWCVRGGLGYVDVLPSADDPTLCEVSAPRAFWDWWDAIPPPFEGSI